MRYLMMDERKTFVCIGSECLENCCIQWDIIIDRATLEYYRTVTGEFGTYLNASIKEQKDGSGRVILKDRRCPMLNEEGLCRIYIELGEEHMSMLCKEYPRITQRVGDLEVQSLTVSCWEAARRLLTRQTSLSFDYAEDGKNRLSPEEYRKMDWHFFELFQRAFKTSVALLQTKELDICQRERLFLLMNFTLQSSIAQKKFDQAGEILSVFSNPKEAAKGFPAEHVQRDITVYLKLVELLDPLINSNETEEYVHSILSFLQKEGRQAEEPINRYLSCFTDRQILQENLLVYHVTHLFLHEWEEKQLYEKAMLVVTLSRLHFFLCAAASAKEGAEVSLEHQITILQRITRIVEHREDAMKWIAAVMREQGYSNLGHLFQLVN